MQQIDLNCDMGEAFGNYPMPNDDTLMDYITSANIACGYHAGDPQVMQHTVGMALKKGVAIGAHPGLPDLQGFGRREIKISANEALPDHTLPDRCALWLCKGCRRQAASCKGSRSFI